MLLKTDNLSKTFRTGWSKKRKVFALKKANICLRQGEITAVTGESGSGKTTLGLILAGLLKPDTGKVFFKGNDITNLPPEERMTFRRQMQMVFQHPETSFNPRWKLQRSLTEPFYLHRIPFSKAIISEQLARVGLDDNILNRYPSQLSGGELQRAAIARVMCLKPAVVILDEPTGMLDVITQARIIRLLEKIQKQEGVSYIFISHDLDLVRFFCKRIYNLNKGQLKLWVCC